MGRPRLTFEVEKRGNGLELTEEEKTINQRIANLRKAQRLTQKEFAEKLNVSDKLVSKWEQEGNTPALEDVTNICKIFNLTLDYLVYGKKSQSDVEALRPLPPPIPTFVDPIQKLFKKIDEIITKNKLQKYKEQLIPSSSEKALYAIVEDIRKCNLEEWRNVIDPDRDYTSVYASAHYKEEYHEDLRGVDKPIDEKYWAQVIFDCHVGEYRKRTYKIEYGVFIFDIFNGAIEHDYVKNQIRLVDYDISFSVKLCDLLALDNFEIYQRLVASRIPMYMSVFVSPQLKKPSNYFNLTFDECVYYEIFDKLEYVHSTFRTISNYVNDVLRGKRDWWGRKKPTSLKEYAPAIKDEYFVRDLIKTPLSYVEILDLTDLRFFGLLQKDELDLLLERVNIKCERVWEIILALIEAGATKRHGVYDEVTRTFGPEDQLTTLMLYEIAKMKVSK